MTTKNVYIDGKEIYIKTYATLEEVFDVFKNNFTPKQWQNLMKYADNKVDQVPSYDSNWNLMPSLSYESVKNINYIGNFKNRALNIDKIQNLIKRLSEDGDITSPELIISLDGRKNVGDGQHRCIACYFLGYKISAIFKPENSLNKPVTEMIRRKNSGQKNWGAIDYERLSISEGSNCACTKKQLEDVKPDGYPDICLYMFIIGKNISDSKEFVKKAPDELDNMMRMSQNDLVDDFETFCEKCLKKLVNIFGTNSYNMYYGFTKFAIKNGIENVTYTGFLNYLDKLEKKFSSVVGPDTASKWDSYFREMYDKYLLNK